MPKATAKGIWGYTGDPTWLEVVKLIILGPLPISKSSKCALVCVDTLSGLTKAFSCHYAKKGASLIGLEKLSSLCEYLNKIDSD